MNSVQNKPHDLEMEVTSDTDGEKSADFGQSGEDDDFAFGEEFSSRDDTSPVKQRGGAPKIKQVQNQPFDAQIELDDEESVEGGSPQNQAKFSPEDSGEEESESPPPPRQAQPVSKAPQALPKQQAAQQTPQPRPMQKQQAVQDSPPGTKSTQDDEEEDEDEEDESSDEEGESRGFAGYNPADYAHLKVSAEVKELFDYITRYKPQDVELDTKLKPFIPEYIPAVGEIDAFLKIPRPDRTNEKAVDPLGLSVLDEPGPVQTDPTVLIMRLRMLTKTTSSQPQDVSSIQHAAQNPKAIDQWVQKISDLHKDKPPPNVNYTKNMPDIEQLMQVWPQELEEAMAELQLPTADLDVDVNAYARIVCSLLDIPVYNSLTESLHVLFTLYSEFKDNQHFNEGPNAPAGSVMAYGGP